MSHLKSWKNVCHNAIWKSLKLSTFMTVSSSSICFISENKNKSLLCLKRQHASVYPNSLNHTCCPVNEGISIVKDISKLHTYNIFSQYIYIALFPPIVEDTHMKIQYSERNKKREIILHTLFKYNVCIVCVGVSPQHRQPSAMWIWSEVYKCEGVCVDGSNRLHSGDDHWLLEPSL